MNLSKCCNFCGKGIGGRTVEAAVRHFQKAHPDHPENCYRDYGKTWDGTLDRILLTLAQQNDRVRDLTTEADKIKKLYQEEAAIRSTLATKLNGIIMILEHKS